MRHNCGVADYKLIASVSFLSSGIPFTCNQDDNMSVSMQNTVHLDLEHRKLLQESLSFKMCTVFVLWLNFLVNVKHGEFCYTSSHVYLGCCSYLAVYHHFFIFSFFPSGSLHITFPLPCPQQISTFMLYTGHTHTYTIHTYMKT